MKSMTGYSSVPINSDYIQAALTVKSWNNRFIDVSVQVPSCMDALEPRIRKYAESRIGRGKIDIALTLLGGDIPVMVNLDMSGAKTLADALRTLAAKAGIDEPLKLSHLLNVNGIIRYERAIDADKAWGCVEPALAVCLAALDAERAREGAATQADIVHKLEILARAVSEIEALCPELDAAIETALRLRFKEIVGAAVEENRVLSEIASYSAKHTINEEIVRLRTHMEAFKLAMGEALCGKKLDFICQELNREANTIGSKSCDARISGAVITMKDAIENIREHIRNVE